jgi:isocitrate lyase
MTEHQEKGTCDLTFGCTDPLQAAVMARHQQVDIRSFCRLIGTAMLISQQTVYVSGALSDTLMSRLPAWTTRITRGTPCPASSIRSSDRSNSTTSASGNSAFCVPRKRERDWRNWDCLTPIVADGDMGFGGLTSTMKLTRAFMEAGVAMFQLDDLAIGVF